MTKKSRARLQRDGSGETLTSRLRAENARLRDENGRMLVAYKKLIDTHNDLINRWNSLVGQVKAYNMSVVTGADPATIDDAQQIAAVNHE